MNPTLIDSINKFLIRAPYITGRGLVLLKKAKRIWTDLENKWILLTLKGTTKITSPLFKAITDMWFDPKSIFKDTQQS